MELITFPNVSTTPFPKSKLSIFRWQNLNCWVVLPFRRSMSTGFMANQGAKDTIQSNGKDYYFERSSLTILIDRTQAFKANATSKGHSSRFCLTGETRRLSRQKMFRSTTRTETRTSYQKTNNLLLDHRRTMRGVCSSTTTSRKKCHSFINTTSLGGARYWFDYYLCGS